MIAHGHAAGANGLPAAPIHVRYAARRLAVTIKLLMAEPTKRAPRVLVVDDEESIRTFAARGLRETGYEVAVASDGPDALTIVEQSGPFDLYLIDLLMPLMRGDELARILRQADPGVKILYFTGVSDWLFNEKKMLCVEIK